MSFAHPRGDLPCSYARKEGRWPSGLSSSSPSARAPGQESRPRSILSGHTSFVYCVAVSPDGKSLASGARDGPVICWDVGTELPKWTADAHKDNGNGYTHVMSVAFSPDGKTLASGGWDHTVRLWDAANGDRSGLSP